MAKKKEKKKINRISWKTEYHKLAKKASNDMQDAVANLSGYDRKSPMSVSDDLDRLAYKYKKLAEKSKPIKKVKRGKK